MVRVLFVNQHYWPDTASTGQHLTDVAEHLAHEGHDVRVLCAQTMPRKQRLATRETRNGVEIQRVSIRSAAELPGRMRGYAGFHTAVAPRLLATRWPEVIVTLTTPPMLGLWGSLASRLRGVEHVTWLMDHHPDAEFEAGMLSRNSVVGRVLECAYRWTLANASRNVVLGPYQGERVTRRGVDPASLATIPIWSRADEIDAAPGEREALRDELGWNGFVVLYSGNAGQVHRFDELLSAMKRLEGRPEIHFAFVGGGPRRPEIEEFVARERLTNASFHPALPRERLGALLSAADAHFVSLRPEQVGVSVPSKLYGQLASARPVLFVGPAACETAEDLGASLGGRTFEIGEDEALASGIVKLARDPETCREMGARGRTWFLERREKNVACDLWTKLIEDVAGTGTRSAMPLLEERACAS